ncbi:MAG: hypothetical protein ACE369_14330 [Roseovarius sp.]
MLIHDAVYDDAIAALARAGGYMCSAEEKVRVREQLWTNGSLNRRVIAKDAETLREVFELDGAAKGARFFMVEEGRPDPGSRFTDEKLSLVLTVYRIKDMEDAVNQLNTILDVCGKGHSVGIHTATPEHARMLAERIDVVRVLVNQAHTMGNGGSFENALDFTLSMGGGTWAGNSITENLNARHFMNITHLVRTIPMDKPSEEALFGDYWTRYGK